MVFVGGLLCALFASVAARPFLQAKSKTDANDALERELLALRLHNQHERTEIESLKTDAGVLLRARQQGFVNPDERPLRIPGN